MKGFTKIGIILSVVVTFVLGTIFVQSAFATNDNVKICHKNNGNGWSSNSVDPSAINGFGNGDHNTSQHQNGQDIIPPGIWDANGRNWTTEGQAIYNNNCNVPEPTPTPTPTSTPTPTPAVTPTPTATPTPVDVCPNDEGVQEDEEECTPPDEDPCDQVEVAKFEEVVDPCVTPTPTEEPTPTPEQPGTPGNPPTFAGSSTEAPSCGDVKPGKVANIFVKTTGNSGELEVQWALPEGANKAHIVYGLDKVAQYALLGTDNDGNEVIKDLTSGQHYWFAVAGVNGCAVGDFSNWYDPLVP